MVTGLGTKDWRSDQQSCVLPVAAPALACRDPGDYRAPKLWDRGTLGVHMARARSAEKRSAILEASVVEIAEAGLGASTASIARRAEVAAGTLFTYFASKEALLNALYLELKAEVYVHVNLGFPHKGSLERRTQHIWTAYLDWAMGSPSKRKVSVQLNVSDVITDETRGRAAEGRELIDATFAELGTRNALRGLPKGFAAGMMLAMQETVLGLSAKQPKQRAELVERAFQAYWKAVR